MLRILPKTLAASAILCAGVVIAQQSETPAPPADSAVTPPPAAGVPANDLPKSKIVENVGEAPPAPETPATDALNAGEVDHPADLGTEKILDQYSDDQAGEPGTSSSVSQEGGLGVTLDYGMFITQVTPNSPAAQLGLQPGDRIISFNGREFTDTNEFVMAVRETPIHQSTEIVFVRNGETLTQAVELVARSSLFSIPAYSGTRTYGYGPGDVAPSETYQGDAYNPAPVYSDGSVEAFDPCCGEPAPVYVEECWDERPWRRGRGFGWGWWW